MKQKTKTPKIKECPRCKTDKKIWVDESDKMQMFYRVECKECGLFLSKYCGTVHRAIMLWNNRVEGYEEIKVAYNIVESNGKTWKENNLELNHTIPLDTLVEIDCDYHNDHGIRLYVAAHTRDCDGTPLYSLGKKGQRIEEGPYKMIMNAGLIGGWDELSLKVIKLPE